jgi:integrase
VGYQPRGKQRVRASCDDLAGREIRKIRDAVMIQSAFKAQLDAGTYVPKRRLSAGATTVADGMDAYVHQHYVLDEMIVVPTGARKRAAGESYTEWLYAVLRDRITNDEESPENVRRASADRARLSRARMIVARLGPNTALASLTLDHGLALKDQLREPEKLRANMREPQLRAVATINRIMSCLVHWGDWLSLHGPTRHAAPFLRHSPWRVDGKLMLHQDSEDNARTRRCPPEEEARLHQHAPQWLSDLIAFAIDSCMRKGEMQRLRVADVTERRDWVRVVGVVKKTTRLQRVGSRINKTSKERWVPVTTNRMQEIIDYHLADASGRVKGDDEYLFCDGTGARPRDNWSYQWEVLKLVANGIKAPRSLSGWTPECAALLDRLDLHWHDLRSEGISRHFEGDTPESQVGWIAGNPSCVQRYNRRRDDVIWRNARCLNAHAEFVKNLSREQDTRREEPAA